MGIGHYRCNTAANEVVYVDHEQIYTTVDPDPDNEDAPFTSSDYRTFDWLDFVDDVKSVVCGGWDMWSSGSPFCRDWYEDMRVVAHSRFYVLGLVEWEGYVAVVVSINEEMWDAKGYSLAKHNITRTADKVFNRLAEHGYTLRVPTSAWTSTVRIQLAA